MAQYVCALEEDINNCPYLSADKQQCTAENTKCGFRIEAGTRREPYVRKERWYEKYMKR